MKIEEQVCNLELARELKELGVKQESYFNWVDNGEKWLVTQRQSFQSGFSAFTVAELGAMLPSGITSEKTYGDEEKYFVSYESEAMNFVEKTEADARAKMLIYLIKNQLLSAKEAKHGQV